MSEVELQRTSDPWSYAELQAAFERGEVTIDEHGRVVVPPGRAVSEEALNQIVRRTFLVRGEPASPMSRWRLGILFRWYSLWIGLHWSPGNKRLCLNLVPFVTFWVTAPGGEVPDRGWKLL